MADPKRTDRNIGRTVFLALAVGLVVVLGLLAFGIMQGEPSQPAGQIGEADAPPPEAEDLME